MAWSETKKVLDAVDGISGKVIPLQIKVKAPTGSTVTCHKGSVSFSAAVDSDGFAYFDVPSFGTWILEADRGSEHRESSIDCTEHKQYYKEITYTQIYGISRDVTDSSPAWTRTNSAVGKTAVAYVGTSGGHSDFDSLMPWAGMVKETISSGDVMVKIPKFWYRRYKVGNVEHIEIADGEYEGFEVHPAFLRAGHEYPYIYVGAYKTWDSKSLPGKAPQASITRAQFRTNARNKGTGWSIIDLAAVSAIQMLYLVEYANSNSQLKVGRGYCDGNSAAINTGSCDAMYAAGAHTGRPSGTDGKVDVMYRGIEGFWGNVWEWTDGLNFDGGTYWVCNDITKFADDSTSGYTRLSYSGTTNWSSSYIKTEGLDPNNSWAMMPSEAGSGSDTTFLCDGIWSGTGWRVFVRGGSWDNASIAGLFASGVANGSSLSHTNDGSRLLFLPS